ncbi:hypothetical protein AB833_27205 [Chromatiales bacterium (ex Bugula neritina AB1)]|nr:hypothetical protein AB833_27205 [Chromatiales bacterium (ex Bugula neritina AB1)]
MDSIQILAGNDLRSGRVVYLQQDGQWGNQYSKARSLVTRADRETAEKLGQTAIAGNRVVDPYFVEIARGSQGAPAHLRERIRCDGPTCLPAMRAQG